MSARVIFHRLAAVEFVAARRDYAAISLDTEARFVASILAVLTRLSNYPQQGNPTVLGCRWMLAAKFRYVVYYGEMSSFTIQIFAVAHGSRRPGYWLRRTRRP